VGNKKLTKNKKVTKSKKGNKKMKTVVSLPTDSEVVDVVVPIPDKPQKKKRLTTHYIDNEKLLREMEIYGAALKVWKAGNKVGMKPRVSEYIGESILKIAERLSSKPNFAMYTYRDEMISDGIENCLTYIDNFNPEISKNPFAYLTQIIFFAFIRRIQREKKQSYIKMKLFEHMDIYGNIHKWIETEQPENAGKNPYADFFKLNENDVNYFDNRQTNKNAKKKTKKVKSKDSSLDKYFDKE